MQIAVWGYSDGDLIPKRVFIVAESIGGQVIGAFDEGGRRDWWGLRCRCRDIAMAGRICTRTCWRCCRSIATRAWAQAEAGAARRCAGPRHRADGVDVRSAGDQERAPEYCAAGGDCAAIQARTFMGHRPRRCRADCRRTGWWRSGGCGRRGCGGRSAKRRRKPWKSCGNESKCRRRSTTGNGARSSVSWLSLYRLATGLRLNRHLRAGWQSPAMNAARRATVAFCWER